MSVKELGSGVDDDGDVELSEVEDIDEGEITAGRENWICEDLIPIELPIICRVPQRIQIFMRSIERVMVLQGLGALEFGVFLKGEFADGVLTVDGDAQFIPQQKVTGATIDFQEDPPDDDYNGVIHRHPTGCKNFSGVDREHINRNFEFSLLYEGNHVILGIINILVGSTRIQLPLKVEVIYPVFNIENPDAVMEKIQKDESSMRSSRSTSGRDFRQQGLAGLLGPGDKEFEEPDDDMMIFADRESVTGPRGEDREEDEDDTELYVCKYCGDVNMIEEWPHSCESCDMVLSEEGAELIVDIADLEPDIQAKAVSLLADRKASLEE